jgi:hypothetical protein
MLWVFIASGTPEGGNVGRTCVGVYDISWVDEQSLGQDG